MTEIVLAGPYAYALDGGNASVLTIHPKTGKLVRQSSLRWPDDYPARELVCENEGATWLPFKPFATLKPGVNGRGSREVLWAATN